MTCMEDITDTGMALRTAGYRKVNPHFIPRMLINMAAGHISIRHKLKVWRFCQGWRFCRVFFMDFEKEDLVM